MNACLIIIGDEILSGNTTDTNSGFIAAELKKIGISVVKIITVADEIEEVKTALREASQKADIIFSTGGIGPTKDDKTKIAYSEFFGDGLHSDEKTLAHLKNLLEKRNRAHLFEINRSQADVLKSATVIQNDWGTAPCQQIEKNGKIFFCLPGVPFEVKPLVRKKIIPLLAERFSLNNFETRFVSVVDFPESLLSQHIENWELALPSHIQLSYLPVGNRIKLRISGKGSDPETLSKEIDEQIETLRPLIQDKTIAWRSDRIEEILSEILKQKKLTVSAAESCTGGEISKLLTSVPGSSQFFLGGITAYDYHKKIEILCVSAKTISEKTVVSAEVAQEMSSGCRKLFRTEIAVSTTGVAGPATDEFNNEVGLVYYSIRVHDFEKTFRLFLPHLDRDDFAAFVAQRVLQDLVTILIRENY